MSFDLYFLSRHPGESWDDAMNRLSERDVSDATFGQDEGELWERLKVELLHYLPAYEASETEQNRELVHQPTGVQIVMSPGELVLSVPYWYDGDQAAQLVELMQQLVVIIENASGLTAYDPQADAPFLGDGDAGAAAAFDRARGVLAAAEAQPAGAPAAVNGWRKFFTR